MKEKRRIAVGMSGGVDSSVAALLLKKQGFDIIGITYKLFCYGKNKTHSRSCCSQQAIIDAKAVCARLGIAHYVINIEKEFSNNVIQPFLGAYQKGITPNPCVECNRHIKFSLFLEKAKKIGATDIATGHYARRLQRSGKYYLLQAQDHKKDQSYFLYCLNQDILAHTFFPLGSYTKKEVRALAKKYNLQSYHNPESQEICFISEKTKEFLKKNLRPKPGEIHNEFGEVIGQHTGAALFTIGQRAPVSPGGPYYVYAINIKKNLLFATKDKNSPNLLCNVITAVKCSWVSGKPPHVGTMCSAQFRYHGIYFKVKVISVKKDLIKVQFARPQHRPAMGQSLVLLQQKTILGGGIIHSVDYVV